MGHLFACEQDVFLGNVAFKREHKANNLLFYHKIVSVVFKAEYLSANNFKLMFKTTLVPSLVHDNM